MRLGRRLIESAAHEHRRSTQLPQPRGEAVLPGESANHKLVASPYGVVCLRIRLYFRTTDTIRNVVTPVDVFLVVLG